MFKTITKYQTIVTQLSMNKYNSILVGRFRNSFKYNNKKAPHTMSYTLYYVMLNKEKLDGFTHMFGNSTLESWVLKLLAKMHTGHCTDVK